MTKGTAGVVGRRCVPFGGGVFRYQTTVCVRLVAGIVHSLYRSSTRGPEDDSVELKHVAPLSHYMSNITIVVFDGPSPLPPPFYYKGQPVNAVYGNNNSLL